MLFETMKSLVKRDHKVTENEEDFFLVSQVQETQYSGANIKEETTHKLQMEESFEWMDLCRICANANDHLIPIFEGEGAELDLSSKILTYLPIHVCITIVTIYLIQTKYLECKLFIHRYLKMIHCHYNCVTTVQSRY